MLVNIRDLLTCMQTFSEISLLSLSCRSHYPNSILPHPTPNSKETFKLTNHIGPRRVGSIMSIEEIEKCSYEV